MKRLRGYTFVVCAAAIAQCSAVTPVAAGSSSTAQLPTQLRTLVNSTRAHYGLRQLRRAMRARALGGDPGDLSSLENPEALDEIEQVISGS